MDGDAAGTYVGYFANEYGEQAVYTYDHETGEATLQMGDAGWHDAYRVKDGQAEGLLLSKTEAMWLRACWLATGGLKVRPTPGADGGPVRDLEESPGRHPSRLGAGMRHASRSRPGDAADCEVSGPPDGTVDISRTGDVRFTTENREPS